MQAAQLSGQARDLKAISDATKALMGNGDDPALQKAVSDFLSSGGTKADFGNATYFAIKKAFSSALDQEKQGMINNMVLINILAQDKIASPERDMYQLFSRNYLPAFGLVDTNGEATGIQSVGTDKLRDFLSPETPEEIQQANVHMYQNYANGVENSWGGGYDLFHQPYQAAKDAMDNYGYGGIGIAHAGVAMLTGVGGRPCMSSPMARERCLMKRLQGWDMRSGIQASVRSW